MKCEIIKDLLPSYVEELTSEESNQEIREHLNHCADCSAYELQMRTPNTYQNSIVLPEEINYLKKIKRKQFLYQIIIGLLVGITFTFIYYYVKGSLIFWGPGFTIPPYILIRLPYILLKISGFICISVIVVIFINWLRKILRKK